MDLPIRFDTNEWYALITATLMVGLIVWLPRRMPPAVSVMVFLFGLSVARLADHIWGAKGAFDFYDVMGSGKYEWMDLLTYPLYGMSAYLFIYLYVIMPLHKLWHKACYVLVWAFFGVLYEYIAVSFHFFNYHGWKYRWSFLVYLIVQPATLMFYHLMLRIVRGQGWPSEGQEKSTP